MERQRELDREGETERERLVDGDVLMSVRVKCLHARTHMGAGSTEEQACLHGHLWREKKEVERKEREEEERLGILRPLTGQRGDEGLETEKRERERAEEATHVRSHQKKTLVEAS